MLLPRYYYITAMLLLYHIYKRSLTVARLEVSVYDGDDGLTVEVVHGTGDLHGPVYQGAWWDTFPWQGSVQRSSPGKLHHQAQCRLLETHLLNKKNRNEPNQESVQDIVSLEAEIIDFTHRKHTDYWLADY